MSSGGPPGTVGLPGGGGSVAAGGFVGTGVNVPGGSVPGVVAGPGVGGGGGGGAIVVPAGGVGKTGCTQLSIGCCRWELQLVHVKQRSWAEALVISLDILIYFFNAIIIFTSTNLG